MLTFEKIFSVMKKMADNGNTFYKDAVSEYEYADESQKISMQEWLLKEFDGFEEWGEIFGKDQESQIINTLLAMSYPA